MIKKVYGDTDVVQASTQRIINVFQTAPKVYLAVSGGKDSICLNDLVFKLCESGQVDSSKLVVEFIDEEAIYPCIEKVVRRMRLQWMTLGVLFRWWCVEVKHFNCLNTLSEDETFICWDRYKKDVWVRDMPDFALTSHPELRARKDSYQMFMERIHRDGVCLIGVRCSESVQRVMNIACSKQTDKIYPIYDWTDADIWRYISDQGLDFPDAYMYMYQIGRSKKEMRISQFFSIDTAGALVRMCEFYPGLFDRVCKREPNAYLAMLYFDTELFRREKTKKNTKESDDETDYKAKTLELLDQKERFITPSAIANYQRMRKVVLQYSPIMTNRDFKAVYNALLGGDPKSREYRAIMVHILSEAEKR